MHESIFKATLRRFFIVLATVLAILIAFLLVAEFSDLFETKEDLSTVKRSLTTEIQPNAKGIRKKLSSSAPVILKIKVDGIIGTDSLNKHTINQQLIESRESPFDDRIKGIIITMNSPGGTATDSDAIYRSLKAYKEQYKIPIYVHVDGLCASGGMCIACAGDKIFATNSSIIGSIGVVAPPIFNFSETMKRIGIESKTMIAGQNKDDLNPFRPWAPDEGKNYQMVIDALYEIFVNIVVANRKNVDKERLIADYGADVFPANRAMEIGFIDSSNQSYSRTLALLAEAIGVTEDAYQVVSLIKESWFQSLFKSQEGSQLLSGNITHRLEVPGQLDPKLAHQFLYLYGY